MHLALKMKREAEKREPHPLPGQTWPTQMPPSAVEPEIPQNLREQGDIANIIQNTTNRRAG